MFDLNTIAELSRTHCISICAFLVPANLIATSATMIFVFLRRPNLQVWQAAGIASSLALIMILHVLTWWIAGVVMLPTFILLGLGSSCLLTNLVSLLYQKRLAIAHN